MLAMIVMMAVGLSTASAIITQPTNVNPINVHLSADHSDPDQQRLRGFFVRPDGHWINFGDGPDLPGVVPVVPSPATETLLVDLAPNEPVAAAAVVPAPSVETLLIDLVPSEPVVAAAVVPVPSAEIHLEPSTSVSAKDVPVPATTKTFLNVGEFLQAHPEFDIESVLSPQARQISARSSIDPGWEVVRDIPGLVLDHLRTHSHSLLQYLLGSITEFPPHLRPDLYKSLRAFQHNPSWLKFVADLLADFIQNGLVPWFLSTPHGNVFQANTLTLLLNHLDGDILSWTLQCEIAEGRIVPNPDRICAFVHNTLQYGIDRSKLRDDVAIQFFAVLAAYPRLPHLAQDLIYSLKSVL